MFDAKICAQNYLGENNNWAMDKDKSIIKYLVSDKSAEHNCQSKSLLTYLIITFIFKRSEFKKAPFNISTKAHIVVTVTLFGTYIWEKSWPKHGSLPFRLTLAHVFSLQLKYEYQYQILLMTIK